MTDVEPKTPAKRKNFANAQAKKGSAKKAKLENVKTPQKNPSPNAKGFNKKNKKNSESENDSPKKIKPFPGTKTTGENAQKPVKQIKKEENEAGEKKKKRRSQYSKLGEDIKTNKDEALKKIEVRIKEIEKRKELTKTARRKLKLLQKLQREAKGEVVAPQQKAPHSKSESTKRRERKKNVKAAENSVKKEPGQANDVKTNGKANKKQKAGQQPIKTEEDSDDDVDDESDDDDEEVDSGDEVEGEESDDDDEAGDESDEEEEEDEEEEDSPPPPKVSNKRQKKK